MKRHNNPKITLDFSKYSIFKSKYTGFKSIVLIGGDIDDTEIVYMVGYMFYGNPKKLYIEPKTYSKLSQAEIRAKILVARY